MSDINKTHVTLTGREAGAPTAGVVDRARVDPMEALAAATERSDVLLVTEEVLNVSKRAAVTGRVRVSTRTETYDDVAETTLDRNVVEVSRVPVGRIVDVAPSVRTEGDTTIVPVIEERAVVVKQLYLKEELHIRHHVEQELSRTPVQLRRQIAEVERLGADGSVVPDDPARQP